VDKSLPFKKRFVQKTKLMSLDFVDYAADIVTLRAEKFCFKTADFVKRNYHKFANVMHHIWIELVKVGIGFRLLNEDFKFFIRLQKGKFDYKY
jgi:hypothetical protein